MEKMLRDKPVELPRVLVMLDTASPYDRQVFAGVVRQFRTHEPATILALLRGSRESVDLTAMGFEAAIIGDVEPEVGAALAQRGRPVVAVGREEPANAFSRVAPDWNQVGRMTAEYFAERSLRHLAVVNQPQGMRGMEWAMGYVVHARQSGRSCDIYPAPSRRGKVHAYEGLQRWLEALPKPVGILAADELVGWTIVGNCRLLGLDVPEQVAVIAAGADEMLCTAADVPLSAIDLRAELIGAEAAKLAGRMLRSRAMGPASVRVPPGAIVTRQSSDTLAIRQPEVATAMRLIRAHAHQGITVEDLLKTIPVNRRWLERHFRQVLGRSIYGQITREKMKLARLLLAQGDLKTAQIARQCGFKHAQHFSLAFKRHTGMTPAAYRRGSRGGIPGHFGRLTKV